MCKFYEQRKQCPYLNRCCFAHGKKELRPKPTQQEGSQNQGSYSKPYNQYNGQQHHQGMNIGQMPLSMGMPMGTMVPVFGAPTFQYQGNSHQNSNDGYMGHQHQPYYGGGQGNSGNMMMDPMMVYQPQQPYNVYSQQQQQPQQQMQKQIVINSQDAKGQIHQRVLMIFSQPSALGNQQVSQAIKQASDFCEQGKVREAEQILQGLCGEGHIVIQETKPSKPEGEN